MSKEFFCPTRTPSSKNGRIWTGRHFIESKATKRWRKETKQWWIDNKELFLEVVKDKEKPYKIGMHFIRGTHHKWDGLNPAQTIQDEMVTHGWIEDDNMDEMIPVFYKRKGKYYGYSKDNPGCYIKIY